MIIPLENQPSMICLSPLENPDPTSIINLETSRIPIKSSNMNLDWSQAFRSWPSVTPGWRNWFCRIANVQRTNWSIEWTPSADSNPVHLLVSFKSATFPLQKSPSLTRVKKWCQKVRKASPPSRGARPSDPRGGAPSRQTFGAKV